MKLAKCFNLCLAFVLNLVFFQQVETSFGDYVNSIGSYFNFNRHETAEISGEFTHQIPYEVSAVDEKFISEAVKLTGVALSELDSCQQRVVLKLKNDCHKLNDEQLAKMAVQLLNCQSYVEGRSIFPCTEDMSIKDCTTNMDSDTWTSYHLMSNRARAVCYSIRQIQFRGLAEDTVNKLMNTARQQLQTLGKIVESQEDIQDIAETTLTSLAQGHNLLSDQQKDIQRAQFHGQLALEDNIRKLSQEKELILQAHNHLVEMTEKIQSRLEDSTKQLSSQADESRSNHQELLDDLIAIQTKAHVIFQRIEESSDLLLKQNEDFKVQYDATLKNLAEVNKTVHNLVALVGGTRQALEERIVWLTTALGGTDLAVERLYLIIWHSAFMMVSMLTCAFLSARASTRLVVAVIPPLHLTIALMGEENQLGPFGLAVTLLSFIAAQTLLLSAISLKNSPKMALTWKNKLSLSPKSTTSNGNVSVDATDKTNLDNYYNSTRSTRTTEANTSYGFKSSFISPLTSKSSVHEEEQEDAEIDDDFNADGFGSPTPPLSRSGFYKSRSRSSTPLRINSSMTRSACHAKTRVGTACKLAALPGRDFCYKHQAGDSVMG